MRIIRADNGFIVQDKENKILEVVVEAFEGKSHIVELLRIVSEHFGEASSKHNKQNVHVITLPGRDYDGPLDKEYFESLVNLHRDINNAICSAVKSDVSLINMGFSFDSEYVKKIIKLRN